MKYVKKISGVDPIRLRRINGRAKATVGSIAGDIKNEAFTLDYYPGAAAAFSVRILTRGAGNGDDVIRLRRSYDDTETYISFDDNGVLDAAAIGAFCGTSLGYVSAWLDQSGNDKHAYAPALSKQPMIWDGAAVISLNGTIAVDLLTGTISGSSNRVLRTATGVISSTADPLYAFAVGCIKTGVTTQYAKIMGPPVVMAVNGGTATNRSYFFSVWRGNTIYWGAGSNLPQGTQFLRSETGVGTTFTGYLDSASIKTASVGTSAYTTSVDIGGGGGSSHLIQEYILYDSDESSTKADIETSINDYFGMY